jgi:hypothetical protein
LDSSELKYCSRIFSDSGLFGKYSAASDSYKKHLLVNSKYGNRRMSSILINTFDSSDIKARINKIVNAIKDVSEDFYDMLILLLVAKIMELEISASEIKHLFSIDPARDPYFLKNEAVNELLFIGGNGIDYKIKSAVTALAVLMEVNNANTLVNVLISLAVKADTYSVTKNMSHYLRI